jgi:serine/threonine protein kinase
MQRWDVRQHIALDIAAGLAIMHQFNIVHGDVKPDNVLIFTQNNPKVPFVAKLSDFGVCIDMQAADSKLTPESYCGTLAWTGPETKGYTESKHGEFSANLLLQFDSYSYGMVLLAIFVTSGGVPRLDQNRESNETDAETAVRLLVERGTPPPGFGGLGVSLMRALRGLLAEQPTLRPFPSPSLLRTDTASYRDWFVSTGAVSYFVLFA